MGEESGEWTIGDRVFVARITPDETASLTIHKFHGDDDADDPQVQLMETHYGRNRKIERQQFRFAMLSELRDLPTRATKGGAAARIRRNLVEVYCACGCEQLTSGSEFKQGHDAKLKSKLRRVSDGRLGGDVETARSELERRGW